MATPHNSVLVGMSGALPNISGFSLNIKSWAIQIAMATAETSNMNEGVDFHDPAAYTWGGSIVGQLVSSAGDFPALGTPPGGQGNPTLAQIQAWGGIGPVSFTAANGNVYSGYITITGKSSSRSKIEGDTVLTFLGYGALSGW